VKLYVIGSLRNPQIPSIAKALREAGHEVFDDWYAAGPEADDYWQRYEKERGHNLAQGLNGLSAAHVFNFDKTHLDASDAVVLVLPAGKSAHLELGYVLGCGKPGYVLYSEEPERWDVMYKFATGVFTDFDSLVKELSK
jgi:nucleoside 2-deoxyribosyltransferase